MLGITACHQELENVLPGMRVASSLLSGLVFFLFFTGFLTRYLCVLKYHIILCCLITCYTRISLSPRFFHFSFRHTFVAFLRPRYPQSPKSPICLHRSTTISCMHTWCGEGEEHERVLLANRFFLFISFLHIPFNSSVYVAVWSFHVQVLFLIFYSPPVSRACVFVVSTTGVPCFYLSFLELFCY